VRQLPVCTEPKFNPEGSSYEIDQRVKAILHQALSVYRVHGDVLKEVRPDMIITQAQCEVCAVSLREVEEVVGQWIGARPQIISLEPRTLADVWAGIVRVAEVLGISDRGLEVIKSLEQRVQAIDQRTRTLPERPTVACIEWIDPLMAAGNWMPELVEMAGGINLFGEAGKHSPWMTWEELVAKDPNVIVVLPCGFGIKRTREEMPALTRRPGWRRLRAIQAGRAYVTDGNQYFNRPGPRLVESLEILAEILHPETFRFGHEGSGWEHF
jgi:iron complex transport system substrate-binding protein